MKLPEYVLELIQELNAAGYRAYAVGGCVRSALLHRPVHDYDLSTSARPEQMREVFAHRRVFDTGIRHGTLTVRSAHHSVEITTFRCDSGYQDHRHPDSVRFADSLKEDCARRDFTVNALCWHPEEGLIDYFGGRQDLDHHILRAIGDPARRFREDALRILRAVRFAAELDFELEPATRAALFAQKDTLAWVSRERIQEEFSKILQAPDPSGLMQAYLPVLQVFLPELGEEAMAAAAAPVSRSRPLLPVRLALLLRTLADPQQAEAVLRRLKYPNAVCADVKLLLENETLPLASRMDLRRLLQKTDDRAELLLDYAAALRRDLDVPALETELQEIRGHDCWSLRRLAVGGRDAQAAGLQGAEIAAGLDACLDAVIEDRLPNTKEALLGYLRDMQK
jgi:tRNA nucleotidyltransferase (CCA-adding enzyme)